jgi:hypothetical protein
MEQGLGGSANSHRAGSRTYGDPSDAHAVLPFLLGTAVGGVAGAVVGTIFSEHAVHFLAAVIHAANRRGGRDDDRLNFELMLQ